MSMSSDSVGFDPHMELQELLADAFDRRHEADDVDVPAAEYAAAIQPTRERFEAELHAERSSRATYPDGTVIESHEQLDVSVSTEIDDAMTDEEDDDGDTENLGASLCREAECNWDD